MTGLAASVLRPPAARRRSSTDEPNGLRTMVGALHRCHKSSTYHTRILSVTDRNSIPSAARHRSRGSRLYDAKAPLRSEIICVIQPDYISPRTRGAGVNNPFLCYGRIAAQQT